MKRFLTASFILILALMLTACGDEGYNGYNDTESGVIATTTQPEVPQETPQAEDGFERPNIHGLLSYVEYGGNRAYIFGSMHLGRPYFFPLADEVEAAMRRADHFIFEFDMTEVMSLAGMMRMASYMMLPGGQTLATYLPAYAYHHMVDVLATFPLVSYDMIRQMRPIAVSMTVLALEIYPLLGISDEYSVDSYVLAFALENDMPVGGLNPLTREMELLFGAPHEVQIASIMSMQSRDTMMEEMLDYQYDFSLVQAYIEQDMDTLLYILRLIEDYDDAFAMHMLEVVLIERSIDFAKEIDRLLRETTTPTTFFVTMGIGHMLGDDHGNVFVVLEEMGHNITPLWR